MMIRDLWLQVFSTNDPEEKYDLLIRIAGILTTKDRKLEEAIRTAEQAAAIYPDRPEAFPIVAEAYRLGGRPDAAIKTICDAAERATLGNPGLSLRQLCARCYQDLGWDQVAASSAAESLEYFPKDPILLSILKHAARDFYTGESNAPDV